MRTKWAETGADKLISVRQKRRALKSRERALQGSKEAGGPLHGLFVSQRPDGERQLLFAAFQSVLSGLCDEVLGKHKACTKYCATSAAIVQQSRSRDSWLQPIRFTQQREPCGSKSGSSGFQGGEQECKSSFSKAASLFSESPPFDWKLAVSQALSTTHVLGSVVPDHSRKQPRGTAGLLISATANIRHSEWPYYSKYGFPPQAHIGLRRYVYETGTFICVFLVFRSHRVDLQVLVCNAQQQN